ncbi:MAG: response regulator transcription factor [Elusimicrobiota bacterium]|jgi:DNA-binding response OmpR family regulator
MGAQILVVDDDDEVAEILQLSLKSLGYESHSECNTAAARAWLSEHPDVFLIISDIMMPDGNGLDFCRWVRSQPKLEKIPIIMCTGLGDDETLKDSLELGAVDFIHKPVSLDVLKEKIRRIIARRGS